MTAVDTDEVHAHTEERERTKITELVDDDGDRADGPSEQEPGAATPNDIDNPEITGVETAGMTHNTSEVLSSPSAGARIAAGTRRKPVMYRAWR